MARALIVYATRTGETERIGELIGEGIRIAGHEAFILSDKDIKNEKDLQTYDALVFGSPTYHGEMMQGMKQILFLAEKAGLEGKVGGSFGAFGWSGEAPGRIYGTMEHVLKMNMVKEPLMLKSSSLGGGIQMAQEYGREIAKEIEGS
jgi:flavorubredoxin